MYDSEFWYWCTSWCVRSTALAGGTLTAVTNSDCSDCVSHVGYNQTSGSATYTCPTSGGAPTTDLDMYGEHMYDSESVLVYKLVRPILV